ncbi:ATP-binding protein [Streptomyces sp. 549]|uniref:ATP-binding protein n=1 Tax=Streptomyces sp. 549 TaxID=3049076 RepID=UPI0024C3486B|nr:ATP-binding protein [Streptomyces sp. 549]MDK1472513.1 ATP-binding protein [Streptomyces sp. 549]
MKTPIQDTAPPDATHGPLDEGPGCRPLDDWPACLPALRGEIRRRLQSWGLSDVSDDAQVVWTELVSNAVRHGTPPLAVTVVLRRTSDRRRAVRIEVSDAGTGVDIGRLQARWRHPAFDLAEDGRGLFLVDALCDAWGDRRRCHGHTVWAEIPAPAPAS